MCSNQSEQICFFVNQSLAHGFPTLCTGYVFPALCTDYIIFPPLASVHVFSSSSDWFMVIVVVMIGQV